MFCQISLEAVRSLGLLLEGSVCPGRAVQPVHRLLTKGPLQTPAGYSILSRSFPLNKLLSCLQHSLRLNPFGITACLRSGKKLAWAQQGTLKSSGIRFYIAVSYKSVQYFRHCLWGKRIKSQESSTVWVYVSVTCFFTGITLSLPVCLHFFDCLLVLCAF